MNSTLFFQCELGRAQAQLAASLANQPASNLGDLGRLFAQIKQEERRLDIVFANAGVPSAWNLPETFRTKGGCLCGSCNL